MLYPNVFPEFHPTGSLPLDFEGVGCVANRELSRSRGCPRAVAILDSNFVAIIPAQLHQQHVHIRTGIIPGLEERDGIPIAHVQAIGIQIETRAVAGFQSVRLVFHLGKCDQPRLLMG